MIPNQLKFFLDPTSCQQRTDPREYFFSIVACSLLKETKYYEQSSQSRDKLIETMNVIADIDPEFILQVAYYVRNQMYIRSVSNFILAFASIHKKTKPFCSTYMGSTILIPGDLIEVCQFTQVIQLVLQNQGPTLLKNDYEIRKHLKFPKVLQKQIKKRISKFSIYQLGKQCSESSRKKNLRTYQECLKKELKQKRRINRLKKLQAIRNQVQGDDAQKQFEIKAIQKTNKKLKNQARHQVVTTEVINIFDTNFITMKDIVEYSHVKEPRSLVLSILGGKYPKTEEEFNKEFKNEPNMKFEPEKAGQRMQIPIPITWDRELSKNQGSKRQIWEELLQKNQVPYLALLRNLRNILKSGVSEAAHELVIKKLSNPQQVQNSKTFPLQYFTALKEIDTLSSTKEPKQAKQLRKPKQEQAKKQVIKKKKDIEEEQVNASEDTIKKYKNAIETAIKISVDKNLDTIPGVTYVFVDVSGSMRSPISGGKKYGSVMQCMDLAFVLAHLIRTKCEQCKFFLFAAPGKIQVPYFEVQFENDTLLEGIQRCHTEAQNLSGSHEMIGQSVLDILLTPKVKADNIVILSDMMVTQGFSGGTMKMEDVFKNYIQQVNENAKFFFMDISGYGQQVSFGDDLKSKNCFVINGMSDNVLKYITYAGKLNQIDDIVSFSDELKAKQQQEKLNQKIDQIQIE